MKLYQEDESESDKEMSKISKDQIESAKPVVISSGDDNSTNHKFDDSNTHISGDQHQQDRGTMDHFTNKLKISEESNDGKSQIRVRTIEKVVEEEDSEGFTVSKRVRTQEEYEIDLTKSKPNVSKPRFKPSKGQYKLGEFFGKK